MGVYVQVKESGLSRVVQRITLLEEQLEQGPGVGRMLEVGKAVMADVDRRFDTGGDGTWRPLSPITVHRKGGKGILVDTGNMRNSVGIGELSERRVTVTVPHGGKDRDPMVPVRHQKGDLARKLPQRKIIDVTLALMIRLKPILGRWASGWRGGQGKGG